MLSSTILLTSKQSAKEASDINEIKLDLTTKGLQVYYKHYMYVLPNA